MTVRTETDARLGLPATVALVVGGIVGTGIVTVDPAPARIPAYVASAARRRG